MSAVARERALREILRELQPLVVAYSGGVDSATLLAVTGRSPSLARGETEAAAALAAQIGARHEIIETHEFDDPRYRENGRDRCYHCKDELFSRLTKLARERGFAHVADGFNADDGRSPLDRRPGHQAGLRLGVRSPLAEAGLGKDDLRAIAQRLGLRVWNKPATPCLSSRVPYGMAIQEGDLRKIDLAERYLRALGYGIVRVRHFGDTALIEVPPERIVELCASRPRIEQALGSVGYTQVDIDPRGYRTGSLNG